ncbi:unnamed protein product [Symbiodinium microadriaticum]|nr:unnamed protein product [Symbiodinium microadriaticum]
MDRALTPEQSGQSPCLLQHEPCYIQDMSTNGTRLNGKRLPRPPYKHPMDARVRIFHGDELVLSLTPEGEELGYVGSSDVAFAAEVMQIRCQPLPYLTQRRREVGLPWVAAPDGVDVLLFVMKKERVSSAEQETLAYVTQLLFGPECLPNLYMVITRAGRLARDAESREHWLQEQVASSPQFAAMVALLGPAPLSRLLFVENADMAEAESPEEIHLAESRRSKALQDLHSLLQRHHATPFRHGIMHRAGQLQAAHLAELRRELESKLEAEMRAELTKDRGALEAERLRFQQEVEGQRRELREQEEELRRRLESEWSRMRWEFERQAKERARQDLENVAKEIVEQTETEVVQQTGAKRGRRCNVM